MKGIQLNGSTSVFLPSTDRRETMALSTQVSALPVLL